MNCGWLRCVTACQCDPVLAIPVLKTIAADAASRVVIPSADGFHGRDNVEALQLSQIHFQPARSLPLIQVPGRSEVPIVRLIRPYGIRIGTGMNGLARSQIPRRDHDMLAEFFHGAGMLPCLPNFFQTAHNVRREPSFAVRGSIQNHVAMSAIEWLEPLVDDGFY